MTYRSSSFILLSFIITACSSTSSGTSAPDDGGTQGADGGSDGGALSFEGGAQPAGFSAYCTGSLLTPQAIQKWTGVDSFVSAGTAPVGTSIYPVYSIGSHWAAVVIGADGSAAETPAASLVPGTDFSTSCKTDNVAMTSVHAVLVQKASFYADASLSGNPCIVAAGTDVTGDTISPLFGDGGLYASVIMGDRINAACGMSKAYSPDIAFENLVSK